MILTNPTMPSNSLCAHLTRSSEYWRNNTTEAEKKRRGQHFTPLMMAAQLSSLTDRDNNLPVSIVDAGAGNGILSTALAQTVDANSHITCFENDERLIADLELAWKLFRQQSLYSHNVKINSDFTDVALSILNNSLDKPTYITSNPPYSKLPTTSDLYKLLLQHGIKCPNLYAAFLALAVVWVADKGQLLFILPRSFTSGAYFKDFRKWLSSKVSIDHVVLYKSRSCFKNVLQETVLLKMTKKKQQATVRLSVAEDPFSTPDYDLAFNSDEVVRIDGWMLPRSLYDAHHVRNNQKRPHALEDLGISLSTGKIELNRLTDAANCTVVYARDFDQNGHWTWAENTKPRIVPASARQRLALEVDHAYVVLKRITSNDGHDAKRLQPALLTPSLIDDKEVALDNHIQYLHRKGKPLPIDEAKAIVTFLKSDEAQSVMRSVCGTTQLNRADINKLRFGEPE